MPKKNKVLIIDDDPLILKQMKWGLANEGYSLFFADNLEDGLSEFKKNRPHAVTLDLNLSGDSDDSKEGFILLSEFSKISPKSKVIMVTGHDERSNSHEAIKLGAYDFYNKPINIDDIKIILKRAVYLNEVESEIEALQKNCSPNTFQNIIGNSSSIQAIFSVIERVANTDASVLITGDSGTGKELLARAIHNLSSRAKEPFIVINCGAIPENLLEAELFGHEKGAFTGAAFTKLGKVETAHNGTLFMDEIGEMPLSTQVKLLRFLQEREIERVGGNKLIKVNIRVVAATNRNLQEEVKNNTFREDLFFRLNVIPVKVPPLRDRDGDIILLATTFLEKFNLEYNKKLSGFTKDAVDAMQVYNWPGNVRELENKIRKAVVLTQGKFIDTSDLDLASCELGSVVKSQGVGNNFENKTLKQVKEEVESAYTIYSLRKHNGHISQTAKGMGVSRPTFYELLKKYQIKTEDFKQ